MPAIATALKTRHAQCVEQAQRGFAQAGAAWSFTNLQEVLAMNYSGRFMFFGLLVSMSAYGGVAQMYPHY
jgi:hypothetical protein